MRRFALLVSGILFLALACDFLATPTPTSPSDFPLTSSPMASRDRSEPVASIGTAEPQTYISFSINVQDFAYPQQSIATVTRIIDIHEQQGVPVDIYLTSTMVDLYQSMAPDLIDRLRTSPLVAVSYHVRPPKPYAGNYDWMGLGDMSFQEQRRIILNYESHGYNLASGRPVPSPGGYSNLKEIMGYSPYAAVTLDPRLSAVTNSVFKELGAQFTLVHDRVSNLGDVSDGLYLKPEHVDLRLYEHANEDPADILEVAVDEARAKPGARLPYFVGIKMHDNDFFAQIAAWSVVYAGPVKDPPWDPGQKAPMLAPEDQREMWDLYEATVKQVALWPDRLIPVNAPEILALVEGRDLHSAPAQAGATRQPAEQMPEQAAEWVPGSLYLTLVSHNEEPSNRRPDFLNDSDFYLENRTLLLDLVEISAEHAAAYNFESDWNYLQAVARYDTGPVTENTGGKNIVRWMVEERNVEVDPHSHESRFNYADVAFLVEQLGVMPTHTVGGFLYSPPDNPQGWEKHKAGLQGVVHPDYFWQADTLWGAATSLHQGSDDHSSGAWRPADPYNFYEHDPDSQLLYIGSCTGDYQGARALLDAIENGSVPTGGFYTAAIIFAQDMLDEESLQELDDFITSISPALEAGRVRWAHLSDIRSLWLNDYGAEPFYVNCDSLLDP